MSLRFRKRIRILPCLWLNLSKSGISTSIGGKGLTINLKNGKTKTTVGIPGTGLSYSETSSSTHSDPAPVRRTSSALIWLLIIVVIALVILVK